MGYLRRPGAGFPLALKLRAGQATLAEVFAFASALYFRGKIAYATRFAPRDRTRVIVPGHGLLPADRRVSVADLEAFSVVPVEPKDARYRRALLRDAQALSRRHPRAEVVLLGSIASGKYVELLVTVFGERLLVP